MFATPKRHILAQNREFWRILRQNPSRGLGCSELQEPPPPKKLIPFRCAIWRAKSRMRGKETPGLIVTNFCTGVGVHDVITSAIFYDSRVRGLSVVGPVGGSNFGLFHWLASSPLQHSRTTVRVCDSLLDIHSIHVVALHSTSYIICQWICICMQQRGYEWFDKNWVDMGVNFW